MHRHLITYSCHVCGFPIGRGEGVLYCPWVALNAARSADIDAIITPAYASLGDLEDEGTRAPWLTRHYACADTCPEDERYGYEMPVEEVDTAAGILGWTVHLWGKTWFASTDWDVALRRVVPADSPAPVGTVG